jgi:hypothetical protein
MMLTFTIVCIIAALGAGLAAAMGNRDLSYNDRPSSEASPIKQDPAATFRP